MHYFLRVADGFLLHHNPYHLTSNPCTLMKKPLILVFVLLLMKLGYSGNHYTYTATSGTPIITTTSVPAGLKHGDTLDIPANASYGSLSVSDLNGIAGDSIVIRF